MSATTLERSTSKTITRIGKIGDLGYAIGNAERMSLESTLNAHKQFKGLDDATKKEWRVQFVIGFVAGALKVSRDAAETIVAKKRTERSADKERAVNAAGQKFRYHISREGTKKGEAAKPARITTEFKVAALKFVGSMYEEVNAQSLREAARMLLAMARRVS